MTRCEQPGSEEISVGALFSERIRQQVVELREQESRVRRGTDSGIHKMRIAVRRLRSALATYRTLLEPAATVKPREELRWLGAELSPARDAQVQLERLELLVQEEPVELVMGAVAKRIHTELTARRLAGLERALAALDSARYPELLDALATAPRFDDAAGRAARTELPRLLERDLSRVRRRAEAAQAASDPTQRDVALHETRKAAKRLRYAAESAVPVFGRRAAKLARRAERVQEVLGEHQDTVVARQTLRELGAQAYLHDENGFTFGRLHALEQARAEELVARYPAKLDRLPTRRLDSWLES